MNKIKALVLDAGGVLVEPLHGNWNIPANYRALLGDYAASIPGEAYLQACAAEASLLREDVFVSGMDEEHRLRLEFLKKVGARLNWQLDENAYAALAHDFTWNVKRYAWYEDVNTWLPRWSAQVKLGILSDSMPSFRHVVESHECAKNLHALVISTEIGAGKPSARMYLTAAEQLGVAPDECLFVDDREGNLEGAMKTGMRALLMSRNGTGSWQGDTVHNLEELNAYLEDLI